MFFNQHPTITVTNEEGKTVQVTDIFSTIKYLEQYKKMFKDNPIYLLLNQNLYQLNRSFFCRHHSEI